MAKCDVCEKNSLLPEKFGSINVCKMCFMKVNGPFWKHAYERYEDAEKHRRKTLETMQKQKYPQAVVSAIYEYFTTQMDAMQRCDCCREPVRHRQAFGKANICDKCFGKINTSAWRETEYEDNEEVESNRQKILKIATKNNFPPLVIDEINIHFNRKIQKGLICTVNGGLDQKLKVYETHCILITDNDFETEEMSKRYGKALKRSRPNGTSFSNSAAKAFAFGALLPGGTLVQAGVRAAASAAISVAADKFISGKGVFRIVKGSLRIDYHTYNFADYAECGDKEKDVGFIRFCRNGGDPYDDIVFLFNSNKSNVKKAYSAICQGIEAAFQPQPVVQTIPVQNAESTLQLSVADEILKFKQLLDIGAITPEEFEAKKKELLAKK